MVRVNFTARLFPTAIILPAESGVNVIFDENSVEDILDADTPRLIDVFPVFLKYRDIFFDTPPFISPQSIAVAG